MFIPCLWTIDTATLDEAFDLYKNIYISNKYSPLVITCL
jgi:hypothetical protein